MDYKSSGVDIKKADVLIKGLKEKIQESFKPEVISEIGGFSGLFDISSDNYRDSVLVSSTDGVGTKLKLAFLTNRHSTIGIDLVGMVVNDIIVTGARPLFMLDYFATGKINQSIASQVISGIVDGCKEALCSLIGGETAEMPGFYNDDEYDLAGFGVGIAQKGKIIDGSNIAKKNLIIGIDSSGPHSNGYSLLRKIFIESGKFDIYNTLLEGLDRPLADVLMTPTKIYVKPILNLLKTFNINGMAHITGGGITENIPRILPERCKAIINASSWNIPPIFKLAKNYGDIDELEMFKTFNSGVGFVLIVPPDNVDDMIFMLNSLNFSSQIIGEIDERKDKDEKIEIENYKNVFKI